MNCDNKGRPKIVAVVSPPYSNRLRDEGREHTGGIIQREMEKGNTKFVESYRYSTNKDNIGNMMDNLSGDEDLDLTQFTKGELYWTGCYDSFKNWREYITPESFSHPAKMAPRLCDRIFKYLKSTNLIEEGDTVCDFMSGIGTTNIMASLHGLNSIGVELEPHFVKMQEANRQKCRDRGISRKWEILQGDSRKLSELLKEKGYAGITSPPHSDGGSSVYGKGDNKFFKEWREIQGRDNSKAGAKGIWEGYAPSDPQNIGNLPDKKLAGLVSPPFEDSVHEYKDNEYQQKFIEKAEKKWGKNRVRSIMTKHTEGYGTSENQLGNQQGESYLQAMLQVYQEAYKSNISPLALVTKNPTRNGKLRRLDIDTAKLLMMAGYEIYDYHRAILFEEHQQATLTGEVKKQVKGRLSFFKRLSMNKGSPVAQWEDVIIAVISNSESNIIRITSPPHADAISKQGGETKLQDIGISEKTARRYGSSEGQIGNLPYEKAKKKEASV